MKARYAVGDWTASDKKLHGVISEHVTVGNGHSEGTVGVHSSAPTIHTTIFREKMHFDR